MRGLPRSEFARKLRNESTDAERRLWGQLRDRRLDGLRFRRQVPIDRYVVDFACSRPKLVVEVDGSQHMQAVAYDAERTQLLEAGYVVLRFWSNQVLANTEGVLTEILSAADAARTVE